MSVVFYCKQSLHSISWTFTFIETWILKWVANAVPQSEELAIVVVIEEVMICVMGRSIDERL